MNILQPFQSQTNNRTRTTFSTLGKAFKKQTEKQADAIKSLNLSNKTDESEEI